MAFRFDAAELRRINHQYDIRSDLESVNDPIVQSVFVFQRLLVAVIFKRLFLRRFLVHSNGILDVFCGSLRGKRTVRRRRRHSRRRADQCTCDHCAFLVIRDFFGNRQLLGDFLFRDFVIRFFFEFRNHPVFVIDGGFFFGIHHVFFGFQLRRNVFRRRRDQA